MDLAEKIFLGFAGAGAIVLGAIGANAYTDLETGIESLDRPGIRARVLVYAAYYGVDARILMTLIHNESLGIPSNYLGDTGASGGPSIGPGQVYRRTAKDYGLWQPLPGMTDAGEREAYAALAQDEDWGIRAMARVFVRKLAEHAGDTNAAIKAYNGSGPNADAYRERALKFFGDTYGELA